MKNKKIKFGILLCLVFFIGIALFVWFRPTHEIDKVLPQGAVVYIHFSQGTKLLHDFSDSLFYKKLSHIDVEKVLTRNKVDFVDVERFSLIKKQWVALNENPWLKKILGKEIVVAFYPDAHNGIVPIFALRLDRTLQAAQTLSHIFKFSNQKFDLSSQQINGVTVYSVLWHQQQQTIHYIQNRDVLILSLSQIKNLDGAIELVAQSGKSMKEDEHWLFTQSQAIKSADVNAFIKPYFLWNAVTSTIEKMEIKENVINELKRFKTMSMSISHQQFSRSKISIEYEEKPQGDVAVDVASCEPIENETMLLAPIHAVVYYWGNCFVTNQSISKTKDYLTSYPFLKQGLKKYTGAFKRRFGVNMEQDILPLIGQEAGVYLTDIDTKAMFPYPRFLFFIKLNDVIKMRSMITTIQEKLPIKLSHEKYHQTDVTYTTLPLGSNTDPGYCILGDYLLLASSRQLLKKTIETFELPARSLSYDKNIKEFGISQSRELNSLMMLRTSAFIKRGQSLMGWIDNLLDSQITTAVTYSKDWKTRRIDFDMLIEEKKEELSSAQERLNKIQENELLSGQTAQKQLIESDMSQMKADMDDLIKEQEDGDRDVVEQAHQSEAAKLMKFNIAHVFMPLLNAFETIEMQVGTFTRKNHVMEVEILMKSD